MVGQSDLIGAQVPDRFLRARRGPGIDSAAGAPTARRGGPVPGGGEAGPAAARGRGPRGRRRSPSGPGPAGRRWCARAGTGRRACRWTTLIPSAARTSRRPGARPAVLALLRHGRIASGSGAAGRADVLGGDEVGLADQRLVRGRAGDDPPVGQVPPLHLLVPQAHVSRVGQVLVGALPVPHLVPGVPRVGQDRGDRPQRPPGSGAVRVAFRVGGRRAESVRKFVQGGGKQERFRRPQGVAGTTGRSK